MSSRPYVKDPSACRFLVGGRAEVQGLFGLPLPPLPLPHVEDGRSVFYVKFHPTLRQLLLRLVEALLRDAGADLPGAPTRTTSEAAQADFAGAFGRMLQAVRTSDRRFGLSNLCWLAHTAEVARCFSELEARSPGVKRAKYLVQPVLAALYRRVDDQARRGAEQADPGRVALFVGSGENTALVDTLLEDAFAFTEGAVESLDVRQFLGSSRRFRISADAFQEIHLALVAEAEKRLKDGDRPLSARAARLLPGSGKEPWANPAALSRLVLHGDVLAYLLGDPWTTGARLSASPRLKGEAERRRPGELVDAFLDLVGALRRYEVVAHLRSQVCVLTPSAGGELDDKVRRGARLYDFGESAQVLNNGVDATVLFLDLRGFTQTSEGYISARDLTQELYTVFDAFVPHIRRFGGTIDKFLGDGLMVTYGTEAPDPRGPLNALRTAILCHEAIIRLRRQGRTDFKMGVSVHYGRVYVARFIADEDAVQTTVIGRNVNLAGRLSSSAKKPMEDDPDAPKSTARLPELQVTVDAEGTLFNEGIVLSGDALAQLEFHVSLESSEAGAGRVLSYYDDPISRRMLIRWAGDAKFKGVGSSFPVYEVDFVR